jgi:divalent metal cation (Fe/Co/Zn/Cd) transporter
VDEVRTHLEPIAEAEEGRSVDEAAAGRELVERIVQETTGQRPRELRFLNTDRGLLAYLTLGLDASTPLAEAHARASEIEERIRREQPEIADVVVHTEP